MPLPAEHEGSEPNSSDVMSIGSEGVFAYWFELGAALVRTGRSEARAAFCAGKAIRAARTDLEWGRAKTLLGVAETKQGMPEDALASLNAVSDRFADTMDVDRRILRVGAVLETGGVLSRTGRSIEAIGVYDELLACVAGLSLPAFQTAVLSALVEKGRALMLSHRVEDALAAFEEVMTRFGSSLEPAFQIRIAEALVNKGILLAGLHRDAAAASAFDEVMTRFDGAASPTMREQIAIAMTQKASLLENTGLSPRLRRRYAF